MWWMMEMVDVVCSLEEIGSETGVSGGVGRWRQPLQSPHLTFTATLCLNIKVATGGGKYTGQLKERKYFELREAFK